MSKRNVIKSFDDWSESVSKEVTFTRPDGTEDVFQIYAITESQRKQAARLYTDMIPPKPQPKIGANGQAKMLDRHYVEAMAEYDSAVDIATDAIKVAYLDFGWAQPNGFKIPGETHAEKVEAVKSKIAGDIDKLYLAIIKISNLQQDDINFFYGG